MIINTSLTTADGCAIIYDPATNRMYLYDNAGTALEPTGVTPASSGSASNGQCTLNGAGSSFSTNGNNLTWNVALTFSDTFLGGKYVILNAAGKSASSSFVVEGTWTPFSAGTPTVVSLSPSSGTGQTQIFEAVYSDPNGFPNLTGVGMIFNTSLTTANGCAIVYDPATNRMYLYDNAGTALEPTGVTPASSGSASNSQCTLNGTGSFFSVSGNDLTLNVALTFSDSFVGQKNVYLYAAGLNGNSGWVKEGTWIP
jgi:hypothetical protein